MTETSWTKRAAPGIAGKATRQIAMPPSVRSSFMLGAMTRPTTAYEAADLTRPRATYRPEFGPAEALMGPLDRLRGACQHETRNNPIAARAVNSTSANIVADGFTLRTPYSDLQRLWNDWQDECLTSGLLDFPGVQHALVNTAVENGDGFFRFRERRDGDMRTVPLQLQLYEGAQAPSGKNEADDGRGNETIAAIQFDRLGRRRGFWMFPRHPSDRSGWSVTSNLVPTWVDGRDMQQVMFPRRLDLDVRGEPWLARILVKLSDLATYDDAELVRKGSTAMFGGFIKYSTAMAKEAGQDIFPMATGMPGGGGEVDFNPGSWPILPPGWEVQFAQPTDVGGQYEPFMRMQMLLCAAGMDMTYEQLTGDWRGINDRQYRASMLEYVRGLKVWQGWVIQQVIKPVWRRFVTTAFTSGRWIPPEHSDPLDWFQCEITPPARGYINPLQEVETFEKAVRAGFLSRTRVAESLGVDVTMIDIENAKDMLRAGSQTLHYTTHQNPLVAGYDPRIVEQIRAEVTRDLLRQLERMRADSSDATDFAGDQDA